MLMIENFKHGEKTDLQPFLIPRDAFVDLYNAVSDNGSVFKKKGYACVGIACLHASTTATATVTGQEVLIASIAEFANRNVVPSSVSITILATLNNTSVNIPIRDDINGNLYNFNDATRASIGNINYVTGKITLNIPPDEGNPQAQSPVVSYGYAVGSPATGVIEVGDSKHLFFDVARVYRMPDSVEAGEPVCLENTSYYAPNDGSTTSTTADNSFTFAGTADDKWRSAHFARTTFLTRGTTGLPYYAIQSVASSGGFVTLTVADGTNFFVGSIIQVVEHSEASLNNKTMMVTSISGGTLTTDLSASVTSGAGGYVHAITGGQSGSGVKVYNGSGFFNFSPQLNANGDINYLAGAYHCIAFSGRMLVFGTYERTLAETEDNYFPLRVRYSAIVNPFYSDDPGGVLTVSGTQSNWHSDAQGRGGFIDLDRGGRIIFPAVINARLLLCLENGVAELRSTGDSDAPFSVRYFDSLLGALSPTSYAHLDSHIMSIGSSGIISVKPQATLLNSLFSTSRIDRDIVDKYKQIEFDNDEARTMHMVRDTFDERVYINYTANDYTTNNRSIVYNYRYNTFSSFRERFNAQGEASIMASRFNTTDSNVSHAALALVSAKPLSVGGTNQGVFLARGVKQASDPDVIISNIVGSTITATNHSLEVGEYVRLQDPRGGGFENGNEIFRITAVPSTSSFTIDGTYVGMYQGGVHCTVVENFRIRSAEFKPFWDKRLRVRLSVMFLMEIDQNVGFTVNLYSSFDRTTPMVTKEFNSSFLGRQINPAQIRWYKDIGYVTGDTVQFEITLSDTQMRNINYHRACHCLHGFQLTLEPSGSIQ